MGEDFHSGDLESRIGFVHKVGAACRNGVETCLEVTKNISRQVSYPYTSIVRHPEKPFYAFGDIVKNLVQIPVDFYHYSRGNAQASFEKKVSRSLALSEAIVLTYGAQKGAHFPKQC